MLNQKSRLKYLALLSASVMMMLAMACGGSDDNGGDSPTSTPGSDGENSPTATSESSSSSDLAENRGVVTVGSTRYDFSMDDFLGIDVCLTLFGVVAGSGKATDGSDVELEFDIPPVGYEDQRGFEDSDPPSIKVEDNVNDHQWAAGGDYSWMTDPPTEDESKVISYTSDGSVAKGTATFIDVDALSLFTFGTDTSAERPEPVTGSFEFHCGS